MQRERIAYLDLLANREHLVHVLHPVIGNLRYVQQTVHAVGQFHKCAILPYTRDRRWVVAVHADIHTRVHCESTYGGM
jgi:hypothetical protein